MAVDARHLNSLLPQFISNRELYYPTNGSALSAFNGGQQIGGGVPLMTTPIQDFGCFWPNQNSLVCESLQPKTSLNTDSGLTCHVPAPPRKRSRDCFENTNNLVSTADFFKNNGFSQHPLGFDIVSPLQQYQLEIDAIVSQHTKKMRMEIEERQKQHARLMAQALGEGLMKKLKEKDEQIHKLGKLNMVLQERLRNLYVENQLWRDMAQNNEAAANTLRVNLEQVLAHVDGYGGDGVGGGGGVCVVEEDVQSCCGSTTSNHNDYDEVAKDGSRRLTVAGETAAQDEGRMLVRETDGKANHNGNSNSNSNSGMCRVCGERESCVLLLPCRHLCLCTFCGSSLLQACPVCNSNMNATVHVNMSSS